ncbi:FAD-dependent oxidoreductase [Deltaproteobacteria bacterium]|nr:FAD-dependent oxidoreductase [Deltaproteobacteria bacterium]
MKRDEETRKDLSRRDFIKTAAVGVGATALTGLGRKDAKAQDIQLVENWDNEADVVVVGYGGAGVVAAITAHDSGAKVLVIEKSPSLASLGITKGQIPAQQISGGGGNSHICMGQFSSPTNAEDAANYLYAACGGLEPGGSLTPMEVCRAWAKGMVKNKAWADEMGIPSKNMGNRAEFSHFPGYSAMYVYQTTGWGQEWFKVLDDQTQKRGIQILFDTPGKELIKDHRTKAIIGVKAESGGGDKYIKARKAVILCTGGFEFNEKLKNQFMKCYPIKFYGWGYNTGDGVIMAQKVGADIWNMSNLCGGSCAWFPDDPVNVGYSARTRTNNYIWVNKFGSRFLNERDTRMDPHKGWMLFSQFDLSKATFPSIPHYLIFDETARLAGPLDSFGRANPPTMGRSVLPAALGGHGPWSEDNTVEIKKGWIKKGDTFEALAAAIGAPMDAATLKATIDTYNGYCAGGADSEFGRSSSTLEAIEKPPFYAVPLYPGLVSTTGGPAVNGKHQVLDPDGKPISGLYAAGTCGSVVTRVYSVTGGNLGGCMASGRISGWNAAAENPWS